MEKSVIFKGFAELLQWLCKKDGYQSVKEWADKVRKELVLNVPKAAKKDFWFLQPCYYFDTPITKDTRVQEGIIIRQYKRGLDYIYNFLGEDGLIYNDEDICVVEDDKRLAEDYLFDMRNGWIEDEGIL